MWLDKAQQQRVAEWLQTHKQQKRHLSLAS
jgi:glycerol-3-phosphate dehydrogenase